MTISPARIAAYEVLLRIERDRGYSSVLLPQFEENLSEKDRSLCHQVVLGVLRRRFLLDAAIRRFSGPKKIDLEVMTILRIGAYQLLFLDRVPDHSAVHESVALVQRAKKSSAKGFVNAILRRIATDADSLPESVNDSLLMSHPQWLLDRWADQFCEDRAVSIALANNEPPRLAFRMTAKGVDRRIDLPRGSAPSDIVEGGFVAERMTPELLGLAEQGAIYFQDEASQMVAKAVSVPAGGRFLDVCAAPGGKTTLIAASSNAMIAGDLYQRRVELLRLNTINQGVPHVNVIRYDAAASLPFADESFDTVLLDAPCSGTGTIRSNPEIRYFLKPEDIESLSSKQLVILRNASKLVKSGGRLYYSTCSLERKENEGVIGEFLNSEPGFSMDRADAGDRFSTPEGFRRTFPDRDGTDGFFFAVLKRN